MNSICMSYFLSSFDNTYYPAFLKVTLVVVCRRLFCAEEYASKDMK